MKTALLRLFFVLLGLAGWPAPAQVPAMPARLDSLRALATAPGQPDTARLRQGLLLCRSLLKANLDSASRWAIRSRALARRLGSEAREAEADNLVGAVAYYKADFPAAQRAYQAGLHTSQRASSCAEVVTAYMGLGNVAQALGDQTGAVAYFEQARTGFANCPTAGNNQRVMLLSNLGNLYVQAKQYARAAPPLQEALGRLLPSTPANVQCNLLDLLAMWELGQHRPARALPYLRREQALARRYHDARFEGYAAINFGEAYRDLRQPAAALPYHYQALALARQLGDQGQTNDAQLALARTLRELGRPEAFDTLARYQALHDTLLARDRVQQVAEAQARFNGAEKQARIAALEKDRRILALEAERRATRTRLLATGGTLAAGLLLAAVLWWYRRRQRRQEAQLRERLAADPHDDLGPLLTQLAVESSLLRENVYAPDQLLARLRHLGETSQQAAQHLGAVLRDLDTGPAAAAPAPLADLANELREHAHEALSPHEMGLTLTLTDPILAGRLLPAATRHALALIFREALHNVVKHAAGATLVRATLAEEAGGLLLTLQDDGQLRPAAATARPGGRGLRSMHTRAEALGGRLTAAPGPGGFEVRAWLPG